VKAGGSIAVMQGVTCIHACTLCVADGGGVAGVMIIRNGHACEQKPGDLVRQVSRNEMFVVQLHC
jgi:hypothetical protein